MKAPDLPSPATIARADEFAVIERTYSSDSRNISVGLANINATVPGVEANKDKILRVASIFKEHHVNVAVFPEFCLSGYFWDNDVDCQKYMESGLTERHVDWIEGSLKPLLDEEF